MSAQRKNAISVVKADARSRLEAAIDENDEQAYDEALLGGALLFPQHRNTLFSVFGRVNLGNHGCSIM